MAMAEASVGVDDLECWFRLIPADKRTQSAIYSEANQNYLCDLGNDVYALNFQFSSGVNEISLGNGGANIFLPDAKGAEISKKHCTFKYIPETGAVLLSDRSKRHNTEIFDLEEDRDIPISRASHHSVIVFKGFNRRIAIGHKKYYQFKIQWESDAIDTWLRAGKQRVLGPWGAKEALYLKGEDLGSGAFGTVFKAIDVRDGKALAVKRFHSVDGRRGAYAFREVNHLMRIKNGSSQIRNDHILEIFGVEVDESSKHCRWVEMFMPVKDGSLKTLVNHHEGQLDMDTIASTVFKHMLLALRCTAEHKLVHRDLKPDNILYDSHLDEHGNTYFRFLLADFGLSNDAAKARTKAGTEPFMAPEVTEKGVKQTTKVDIWSLFACLVWLWDIEDFRRQCWRNDVRIYEWLPVIANQQPQLTMIRNMAQINPEKRPSAKVLLKAKSYDFTAAAEEVAADVTDDLADTFEDTLSFQQPQIPGSYPAGTYYGESNPYYAGSSQAGPSSSPQWADAGHYEYGGAGKQVETPATTYSTSQQPRGHGGGEYIEPYDTTGNQYGTEYSHGRMDRDYADPDYPQTQQEVYYKSDNKKRGKKR